MLNNYETVEIMIEKGIVGEGKKSPRRFELAIGIRGFGYVYCRECWMPNITHKEKWQGVCNVCVPYFREPNMPSPLKNPCKFPFDEQST